MGYAQFQRIDELVGKKRWIFERYRERLADIEDIAFNPEPEGGFNSVWITGLLLGKSHRMNKLEFIAAMKKFDAPARPFFYPLSSLPAYPGQEDICRPRNRVAYDICARGVNLPGALILDEKQIDFVCDAVHKVLRK
jgi:perosamine synthetase